MNNKRSPWSNKKWLILRWLRKRPPPYLVLLSRWSSPNPLSFPIVVIYPRNNQDKPQYQIGRKFAEMLTTEEGQA